MAEDRVRRPEVTLVATSAPMPTSAVEEQVPTPPRRRSALLVVVPLVLVALVLARPDAAPEPSPPPPAGLVLLEEQLVVTQSGILVVPVELQNPGDVLQVRSAVAYAQPVVDDPVVQAPEAVRARSDRRFVALLAPDCRLLQPGSPLRFSASVMLQVGRGSSGQELVLDLATAPEIRDRVQALCRRDDAAAAGGEP